jgi:hypothetical protein
MAEHNNSRWWQPESEWAFAGLALAIFIVAVGLAGLITAFRQDSVETQGLARGISALCALVLTLILYRRWRANR